MQKDLADYKKIDEFVAICKGVENFESCKNIYEILGVKKTDPLQIILERIDLFTNKYVSSTAVKFKNIQRTVSPIAVLCKKIIKEERADFNKYLQAKVVAELEEFVRIAVENKQLSKKKKQDLINKGTNLGLDSQEAKYAVQRYILNNKITVKKDNQNNNQHESQYIRRSNLSEKDLINKIKGFMCALANEKVLDYAEELICVNPKNTFGWICKTEAISKRWTFQSNKNLGIPGKDIYYNVPDALVCIKKALKINKTSKELWKLKISILEYDRNYEEVLRCYNELLLLEPENINFKYKKIEAYKFLGKNQVVLEECDKIIKSNKKEIEVWKIKADIYRDSKDYIKAIKYYNMYLRKKDFDLKVLFYKSFCLIQLREYRKCIQVCDKIIKRTNHKSLSMVYYHKGSSLMELGNLNKALYNFNKGLEFDKTSRILKNSKRICEDKLKKRTDNRPTILALSSAVILVISYLFLDYIIAFFLRFISKDVFYMFHIYVGLIGVILCIIARIITMGVPEWNLKQNFRSKLSLGLDYMVKSILYGFTISVCGWFCVILIWPVHYFLSSELLLDTTTYFSTLLVALPIVLVIKTFLYERG